MLKLFFFLRFYLFLRERGKGEGERERHQCVKKYISGLSLACPQLGTWPTTQACALTSSQTGNLLVHRAAPVL